MLYTLAGFWKNLKAYLGSQMSIRGFFWFFFFTVFYPLNFSTLVFCA